MSIYKYLAVSISIVVLSMFMLGTANAAIQFDFMEGPWALSSQARDELIRKFEEIDFKQVEQDLRDVGKQVPDELKNLPGKTVDKFEKEGIDVKGAGGGLWTAFSNLGTWMLGSVKSLIFK